MRSDRHSPLAAPQEATTIGGYCTAIAKALDASGVDSERIFRSVGVQPHMANGPMVRLPVATLTRLYRACVAATMGDRVVQPDGLGSTPVIPRAVCHGCTPLENPQQGLLRRNKCEL